MTDALSIETLTERDIAKTIDHSLLRPELDDAFIEDDCRLAAEYDVASAVSYTHLTLPTILRV